MHDIEKPVLVTHFYRNNRWNKGVSVPKWGGEGKTGKQEGLLQNILSRTHTQKTLFETYLMMS